MAHYASLRGAVAHRHSAIPCPDLFVARFSEDEIKGLGNSLNEVLCGFRVDDCERKIGGTEDSVQKRWNKLAGSEPDSEVFLPASEITFLCRAIRLCYREFGSELFSTRLGFCLTTPRTTATQRGAV